MIALSIILFSGGMDTKYSEIKPVAVPGIILATLGVMLTALLTGGLIYCISGILTGVPSLTFTESLLLASVMSSTDSASVFSILRSRGLRLKENLRPLLELESGSNDPMAYMLTILLIQIIQSGDMSFSQAALMLLQQFAVGAVAGYLLGRLALHVINRLNIDNEALYPILLVACVFFIFAFTDLCKGNGYLAVYLAGLVIGNRKMLHKKSIVTFFDGFAWLFQLIMFLALGLLVNPKELLPVAGIGLLVGGAMILLTRPLSVWLCLLPFRKMSGKAKIYVSWVGLRGAVPIIFAHLSAAGGHRPCAPDLQYRLLHHDPFAADPGHDGQLFGAAARPGQGRHKEEKRIRYRTARRDQIDDARTGRHPRDAHRRRPAHGDRPA